MKSRIHEYGARYFLKGVFPCNNYLSGNFPTVQFPKVRLGLLSRRRLQWGAEHCGWDGLEGRALRLRPEHIEPVEPVEPVKPVEPSEPVEWFASNIYKGSRKISYLRFKNSEADIKGTPSTPGSMVLRELSSPNGCSASSGKRTKLSPPPYKFLGTPLLKFLSKLGDLYLFPNKAGVKSSVFYILKIYVFSNGWTFP